MLDLFGVGSCKQSQWSGRARLSAAVRPVVEQLEARRLLSAGQLEPTFGNGGIVTDFSHPGANAVAVQADGKIIEAGLAHYGGQAVISIARFNANGTLDTTFGYLGGFQPGPGTSWRARRIAPQSAVK